VLFDDKEVAKTEGYLAHLNQYHVFSLDMVPLMPAGRSLIEDLIYCVEETGRAFIFIIDEWIADVVYLPKQRSLLPALVVELKWNRSSEGENHCSAIRQIKERNYPAVLQDYGGEVVMVGIDYDAKKKEHSCVIERI